MRGSSPCPRRHKETAFGGSIRPLAEAVETTYKRRYHVARPKNKEASVELRIMVLPVIKEWLDQLAEYGVYGKNHTAVAEHFVREGVNKEIRDGGLLKDPPPRPKKE